MLLLQIAQKFGFGAIFGTRKLFSKITLMWEYVKKTCGIIGILGIFDIVESTKNVKNVILRN